MRKTLPPEDPNAVLVCLPRRDSSHHEVKALIEAETKATLTSVQFDPIFVQSEKEIKSQWILRFADRAVCERLVLYGLRIDGVRCQVRHYDKVMKEEYDAFTFLQLVNKLNKKGGLKQGRSKAMQTQTLLPALK